MSTIVRFSKTSCLRPWLRARLAIWAWKSAAPAIWKRSPHANAYETLVKDHKQFNLDCVSCHVSGYEKPGGSTVTHVLGLTDVQCEVCHGPGSLHVANPADPALIQAAPPRSFCADTCHHPPHVKKGWSADEAWKLILGPGHGR